LLFAQSCHLHSTSDGEGAFTAQGREALSNNTGFSFVRCDLTGKPGKSVLGRPWRPYARVVFALCNMSNTVAPVGWNYWKSRPQDQRYLRGWVLSYTTDRSRYMNVCFSILWLIDVYVLAWLGLA
jgi:pectin methylesterase-like acyl-CoA thioesterase